MAARVGFVDKPQLLEVGVWNQRRRSITAPAFFRPRPGGSVHPDLRYDFDGRCAIITT